MGGGGFDGTVVTGLDVATVGSATAPGQVAPINLGYVTFGSDGGSSVGDQPAGSFGLNPTAFANYTGQSVKKTRDAGIAIVKDYYGRPPAYQHFQGGSKGGQEALIAAERYGKDYSGIIAYYPAQFLAVSWYHLQQVAYGRPGGYLGAAKQQLYVDALYNACDRLDGAVDGLISNGQACRYTFSLRSLRCPAGADSGETCLSDAQIETLEAAARPFYYAFPLANGVRTRGEFPIFDGATPNTAVPFASLGAWLDPNGNGATTLFSFFDQAVINYFIKGNTTPPPLFDLSFNYLDYKARIQQISQQWDTTNPDMDAFVARGGKLILVRATSTCSSRPRRPRCSTGASPTAMARTALVGSRGTTRFPATGTPTACSISPGTPSRRSTGGWPRASLPERGRLRREHRDGPFAAAV